MQIAARPVLALALCAGLAGVTGLTSASAAPKPKPVCNLVTDKKGDGTGFVQTDRDYLPNNPNLDLVSGDVASDAKRITAVIRTDKQALTDSTAPTGRTYYANFTANNVELFLSAALDSAGTPSFTAGYIDTTRTRLGGATGVVDTTKGEIRITAPISLFAGQVNLKAGTEITDLELLAQRYIGHPLAGGATPSADAATGGKAYRAGAASCVKVGK